MPRFAGLSLSVVGAIVLGDAAIKAGLLGAPAVMIGALSGIGLYTMPDNTLLFSLLRLVLTLVGGLMGLYGLIIAGLMLLSYMIGLSDFGSPYLAPFAPSIEQDKKDALFKRDIYSLDKRPHSIRNTNKTRLKRGGAEK
ncbi:MAG: spore germination protein, partial [Christensenellales bacterium]